MESDKLIEISKIYVDKDGAGRLYVPKKILEALKWEDKEQILIKTQDSIMIGEPVKEASA